jgi:HlyD family secretion protein
LLKPTQASGKVLGVVLVLLVVISLAASAVLLRPYVNQAPAAPLESSSPPPAGIACLGHIEPEDGTVRLGARSLSGQASLVADLRVKEGDSVRVGQIIATLNSKEQLEAAWLQAEANVRVAQAKLGQVRAGVKAADLSAQQAEIARIEAELVNAQAEYQRTQRLHQEGLASNSVLDASKVQVDTRIQMINNAKERLRSLAEVRDIDVDVAASEVQAAQAESNRAHSEYEASIIHSPYNGRVLKVIAWPGAEIGSEGLVEIARVSRMYVIAEVDEHDISRVKLRQRATITGGSLGATKLQGTVAQTGMEVAKNSVTFEDPKSLSNTHIIEVKILLDDSKLAEKLIHAQVEVVIAP